MHVSTIIFLEPYASILPVTPKYFGVYFPQRLSCMTTVQPSKPEVTLITLLSCNPPNPLRFFQLSWWCPGLDISLGSKYPICHQFGAVSQFFPTYSGFYFLKEHRPVTSQDVPHLHLSALSSQVRLHTVGQEHFRSDVVFCTISGHTQFHISADTNFYHLVKMMSSRLLYWKVHE